MFLLFPTLKTMIGALHWPKSYPLTVAPFAAGIEAIAARAVNMKIASIVTRLLSLTESLKIWEVVSE